MDGNYCSVADVKNFLEKKLNTVANDGLLQIFVDGASRFTRNRIGRDILTATATEYYNGNGSGVQVLRRRPVTAVASVAVGAPNVTRTTLVLNTDYVWDERSIQLLASIFTRGVQNLAVQYTAGYVGTPPDLREKVAKMAATRFRELDRLGQASKSLGAETITFDLSAMPKDVRDVIGLYSSQVPV